MFKMKSVTAAVLLLSMAPLSTFASGKKCESKNIRVGEQVALATKGSNEIRAGLVQAVSGDRAIVATDWGNEQVSAGSLGRACGCSKGICAQDIAFVNDGGSLTRRLVVGVMPNGNLVVVVPAFIYGNDYYQYSPGQLTVAESN